MAPAAHRPAASPVALITGASSGIGEGIARRFAQVPGITLVLVARREDRLRALAEELPVPVTYVACDLTEEGAPALVADHIAEHHGGRLTVLVNNAGAGYRGSFEEKGYANVQRSMQLNFDAPLRLSEALLPLLRASNPSALVNIASTAGRIARPGAGAYSASKFALAGWTDSLRAEEKPRGVHVGLVMPGFIRTEGFPARELLAKPQTRWMVSTVENAAQSVYECAFEGKAERYVPRWYWIVGVLRLVAPGLIRRVFDGSGSASLTTSTGGDYAAKPPCGLGQLLGYPHDA